MEFDVREACIRVVAALVAWCTLAVAMGARAEQDGSIELSGRYAFSFGWVDSGGQDGDGQGFIGDLGLRVHARFRTRQELAYGYRLKRYGVRSDFEWIPGGNRLQTDEAFAYFEGDFGYLSLGDDDGAADRLAVFAPVLDDRGFWHRYLDSEFGESQFLPGYHALFKLPDSGDSSKLAFITPRRWGVRAGVSYAPEGGDEGDSFATRPGVRQRFVEGAVQYRQVLESPLSGLMVTGSFSFVRRDGEGYVGREGGDSLSWAMGGQVGYAGFAAGGAYLDHGLEILGDGFESDTSLLGGYTQLKRSWNLGLSYTNGPVQVGGQYAVTAAKGSFQLETWGVGVVYRFARGVHLTADYVGFINDSYPVAGQSPQLVRIDGNAIVLGSVIEF